MWKAHSNAINIIMLLASKILKNRWFIPAKMYGNLAHIANELELPLLSDSTRFLQMGLIAQEIDRRNLTGAIAEFGVYQGSFSYFISRAFSGRKYYLFDTFEGFDETQLKHDNLNFSAEGHDFKNTSIKRVASQINKKYDCELIIKKGFFPDSAKDVNDQFVFVSIDVDLYQPTLDGLNYFYPRMVPGGYIMVHDLMADRYKGCRQAIYEFCDSQNIFFTPLPDAICSALIVKSTD
jgi:O-methyltransferase